MDSFVSKIGRASNTLLKYNNKPIYCHKFFFNDGVPRTLEDIKEQVNKYVKKLPSKTKFEYVLNIKFNPNSYKSWTLNTHWLKHNEIMSLERKDYEYLRDSKIDEELKKAVYFELFVRTAKNVVQPVLAVGDDLHNDCLFNAILKCFNYDTKHFGDKVKTPEGFKKMLKLQRNDRVPIDECYPKIEDYYKIHIHQSGSYDYEPETIKYNYHVYLKCIGEHVELKNPPEDTAHQYINFQDSDKIYTIHTKDKITVYDGNETYNITFEEYEALKRDFSNILVKVDKLEELESDYKKYIKNADGLNKLTNNLINKYRSPYDSALAYNVFRKFSRFLEEPDKLSELEMKALNSSFHGGLRYSKPDTYKGVIYDYDINKMYSHYLSSSTFAFPVKEPKYIKLDNDKFNDMYELHYKFGLYKIILKTNHALFNYKLNKPMWFSHHDLNIAKLLKLEYCIDESSINCLEYDFSDCVTGFRAFRNFFSKCQEWINDSEKYDVDDGCVKQFTNSLWGGLCSKRKIKKRITVKSEPFDIDDYHLNSIESYEKSRVVELVDKRDIFKYNWARVAFITSYCRYKMVTTILPFFSKIVYINTDGFSVTEEQPKLKISKDMGDWKVKKYDGCVVLNSNSITFGEQIL